MAPPCGAGHGKHATRASAHGAAPAKAGCSGAAGAQGPDQGSGGNGDDTGDRAGLSRRHGARPGRKEFSGDRQRHGAEDFAFRSGRRSAVARDSCRNQFARRAAYARDTQDRDSFHPDGYGSDGRSRGRGLQRFGGQTAGFHNQCRNHRKHDCEFRTWNLQLEAVRRHGRRRRNAIGPAASDSREARTAARALDSF